jgi:hypothetical protein
MQQGPGKIPWSHTFFKKDRARCMGVWAVMVTLGVPLAPLLFGFVTSRVGYRWIYWSFLAEDRIYDELNAVGLVQLASFSHLSEVQTDNGQYPVDPPVSTLYIRGSAASHVSNPTLRQRFLHVKRIDPAPLEMEDTTEEEYHRICGSWNHNAGSDCHTKGA